MRPSLTLAFLLSAALGAPLAGRAQAPAPAPFPRYYVGVAVYGSYYQTLRFDYRGPRVPVQVMVGYQLRPRLALQLGVAYSSYTNSYFNAGRYYTNSAAAASPYTYYEYAGATSQHNTSLALLARYTLTRQPAHRFQVDVLGGFAVELQHNEDLYTRTDSDSTKTLLTTTRDDHHYWRNYLLLTAGLSPRYRFGQHAEVFFDFTLNKSMLDTYKVLSSAAALGLRYRFGGLR
ncbi:MAG: hypothetical protein ACRYFK_01035 [Janthinobacterium lividum]